MELGPVELVLAIEEEFKVHIPSEDVVRFERVGDIHDWLFELFRRTSHFSEEEIWERLQRVIMRELLVPPREVTKAAHLLYDLDAD